jgi:hypothetical protein
MRTHQTRKKGTGLTVVDSRQELLTGDLSQERVDIIGCGMHGSWAAIALARMGVGTIRLWDEDTVGEENLETQFYRPSDVGKPKTEALRSLLRSFGYSGQVIVMGRFSLDDDLFPIVSCHADSMAIRQDAAKTAMRMQSKLFMESRSAANEIFFHAFKPAEGEVAHYLENYFPETVATVACGETGTAAVGMQVAALVGGTMLRSNAGEHITAFPEEHSVSLGMYHAAKRFDRGS